MNTFQLSCFLAVANSLSFAQAARQMNISQPAITHQIKSLESELNVKLFRRSTRLVEITAEGQAFISDAKSMVTIAEQAKMRFSSSDSGLIEVISIGCGSYALLDLLTDTLHDLVGEYPGLHPRFYVVPREQLFHLLETDTVDVVFDVRESAETPEKLAYRELRQSPRVGVCRPDHPAAGRESISLQDLAQENLIFCDPVMLSPDAAKLQWKLAEGRMPAELHFCQSLEAAVVLAGAGFGLAILPELFVAGTDDIAKLKIEDSPLLSFGLFHKPYSGDTLAKKFVQIAKRYFPDV